MSTTRNQNQQQNHNISKLLLENVSDSKYLRTVITIRDEVRDEIGKRKDLENNCFYSVQKLQSSSLLSETLEIKIFSCFMFL
jgi:hypothetical protein